MADSRPRSKDKKGKKQVLTPKKGQLVFGLPLQSLVDNYRMLIPQVVSHCVVFIEKSLSTTGLFVKDAESAYVAETSRLRKLWDKDGNITAQQIATSSVHAIVGLLKLFLSELPDPLLTFEAYPNVIKTALIKDPQERIKALQQVISNLPEVNKFLISYLMSFFGSVTAYCVENKMDSKHLGFILAPYFLPAKEESALRDMALIGALVTLLIEHCSVKHSVSSNPIPKSQSMSFAVSAPPTDDKKDKNKKKKGKDEDVLPSFPTGVSTLKVCDLQSGMRVETVKALFDYRARNEFELSFKSEDTIQVTSTEIVEEAVGKGVAWWHGRIGASSGLFPPIFCKVIKLEPIKQLRVDNSKVHPKILAMQQKMIASQGSTETLSELSILAIGESPARKLGEEEDPSAANPDALKSCGQTSPSHPNSPQHAYEQKPQKSSPSKP